MKILGVLITLGCVVGLKAVDRGRVRFGSRQLPIVRPEGAVTELTKWDVVPEKLTEEIVNDWPVESDGTSEAVLKDPEEGNLGFSANLGRQFYPGFPTEDNDEVPMPIFPSNPNNPNNQGGQNQGGQNQGGQNNFGQNGGQGGQNNQQGGFGQNNQLGGQTGNQGSGQNNQQNGGGQNNQQGGFGQAGGSGSNQQGNGGNQQGSGGNHLGSGGDQMGGGQGNQGGIPAPGCGAARGQFPSPTNCANYLNCWDETVIEQQCPDGLLFNGVAGYCDFEMNVDCGNRPGPTPKPVLASGSKRCPDMNGRYRSQTNCSVFYVCLAGTPIMFNCPPGLVYNDILGVCDYTYNVDCGDAATPRPLPPTSERPSGSGSQGSQSSSSSSWQQGSQNSSSSSSSSSSSTSSNQQGSFGGSNQQGSGSNQQGSSGSNQQGSSGSNQQGSFGGSNQQGSSGSNQQGSSGSNQQGSSGSNQGSFGGSNQQGSSGSNQQGSSGSNQGSFGGSNQQGSSGSNQQGSTGSNQGSFGGSNQQGSSGSNQQGSSGSNQQGSQGSGTQVQDGQRPPPTFPPGAYPQWGFRSGVDPWNQRPVASQHDIDQLSANSETQSQVQPLNGEDNPESATLLNPWSTLHSIPAELTKSPCENGKIHRLDDACTSVVVCKNNTPQLVKCETGFVYDRPSDSCRHFSLAKCY